MSTKQKVVAHKVGSYFIVLPTDEHVQALLDVLACVAGDRQRTRRRFTEDILEAIHELDFTPRFESDSINNDTVDLFGEVMFYEKAMSWDKAEKEWCKHVRS